MKAKSFDRVLFHPPEEKDGPLTRDDVLCPVCWSILIEPVTFPCAHSICLLCFRNTVREACFTCPCCRVRISNWSRRAEKSGTLVNEKLWQRIQAELPKFVAARQLGQDSQDVLAEISADEEGLLDVDDDVKEDSEPPLVVEKLVKEPNVPVTLEALREKAAILQQEEIDAQLIRKFRVEDGFGTQQIIFDVDDDSDAVPSLSTNVIVPPGTSVHVEPVVQLSQNKAGCGSQGKVLCRNLFSEWEMHAEPAAVPMNSKPVPSSVSKSSSQDSPRAPKKRINRTDKDSGSILFSSTDPVSQDFNVSSVKATPPKKTMASSFVTVCSPRLMTGEMPNAVNNGACKVDESIVTEKKSKQADTNKKRSHLESPDTPDSINIEVNSHFRPIRSAPRTPPKQLPDGSFLPEPKLVKATPTRLAPIPGLFSTIIQSNTTLQSDSTRHSSTSNFSDDSGGSPPSTEAPPAFTPPPPALVHYAVQGVSPNGYASDTQEDTVEGRLTGPPPELEAIKEAPSDGYGKERKISEIMYRKVQAYQLEQFRKRKLQEDKDREYAEKLQRELNKLGPGVVRTRGSSERYSIRSWNESSQPSSSSSSSSKSKTSSAVPGKKHSERPTRSTRAAVPKSPTKARNARSKGKAARKSTTARAKASPKRPIARRGRPQTRKSSARR